MNSVFGDLRNLRWARIVSITPRTDDDGSTTPDISATSVDGVHYRYKVVVYRPDDSGTISDVTNGVFFCIEDLTIHYGEMRRGQYYNDQARMRDTLRQGQLALNKKFARSSKYNQEQLPVLDPSIVIQDMVLRDVMERVQNQHIANLKAAYALPPSSQSSPSFFLRCPSRH